MVLQVGLAKVLSRENVQMSMESTFDWAAPEVMLSSVPGPQEWPVRFQSVAPGSTASTGILGVQVLAGLECSEKADIWSLVTTLLITC